MVKSEWEDKVFNWGGYLSFYSIECFIYFYVKNEYKLKGIIFKYVYSF